VGRDPESGLAVFAWPAITGEEATVRITSRSKNLLRGVVSDLHSVAPERTTPPCPYFGTCGGCQWQHINYAGQVAFKHGILRSQLQRSAGIMDPDAVLRPPIASPGDFNYRNTSHFAIDSATHTLGYFRRDSHTVVPVIECPISNSGINRALPIVNGLLAEAFGPAALDVGARGTMRVWNVAIRSSETTGQTLVVLHSRAEGRAEARRGRSESIARHSSTERPDIGPNIGERPEAHAVVLLARRGVRNAIAALSRSESGKELALMVVEVMDDGTINRLGETRSSSSAASDAIADTLLDVSLAESAGRATRANGAPIGAWIERLAGRTYWVGPDAFFQVNTPAAELLLAEVREHLPQRTALLLDAYAGVGTFALAFAKRAKHVIGFEVDSSAVSSARWNAQVGDIANVEFRQGKAEALIRGLKQAEQPDVVLLDPPRSGCHPALLAEIERRNIQQIIYVSCDTSTLARDIKLLSTSYRLDSARVVDMFPQTYHIETVAAMSRK